MRIPVKDLSSMEDPLKCKGCFWYRDDSGNRQYGYSGSCWVNPPKIRIFIEEHGAHTKEFRPAVEAHHGCGDWLPHNWETQ